MVTDEPQRPERHGSLGPDPTNHLPPGGAPDPLERLIGRVLIAGTITATGLLALGLACWLAKPGGGIAAVFLDAGLVVLMATPVGRVVASVVEYARERDWLFVAITLAVLLVLAGTLVTAVRTAIGR